MGTTIVLCSFPAQASEDEAALTRWLEGELHESREFPQLTNIAIQFRYEMHWPKSPGEIERLRRATQGLPQHPDRMMVDLADRRLREGPMSYEITAHVRGEGHWRISRDLSGDTYRDVVVAPDYAWSLTPNQLTLIHQEHGWPENQRLDTLESELVNAFAYLFYGGLHAGPDASPRVLSADRDGLSWHARIDPGDGRPVWRVAGRWDVDAGRGFVTEVEYNFQQAAEQDLGSLLVVSDWDYVDTIDRYIARRAEFRYADGSLHRAYVWLGAEREEPERFESVFRMPRDDGDDFIRGPLTVTSVADYRSARAVLFGHGPDGRTQAVLREPEGGTGSWKSKGWFAAGAVLTALVALRVRKSQQLRARTR